MNVATPKDIVFAVPRIVFWGTSDTVGHLATFPFCRSSYLPAAPRTPCYALLFQTQIEPGSDLLCAISPACFPKRLYSTFSGMFPDTARSFPAPLLGFTLPSAPMFSSTTQCAITNPFIRSSDRSRCCVRAGTIKNGQQESRMEHKKCSRKGRHARERRKPTYGKKPQQRTDSQIVKALASQHHRGSRHGFGACLNHRVVYVTILRSISAMVPETEPALG